MAGNTQAADASTRKRCQGLLELQAELKQQKREREGLDRVTSRGEVVKKRKRQPIQNAEGKLKQNAADEALARAFYLNNIAPDVLDSKTFQLAMQTVAKVVEFVSSRDCTGKVKDKEFIANEVIDYILSLPDPFKIVQVLMDMNATRGSWPIIEKACPWVIVGPCEPHVASLEVGDMCKLPFFKNTIQKLCFLLRLTDSNRPTASKVQYHKFEVQEKLKVVTFDAADPPWDNDEYDLEAMKQEIVSIHRYR
ncbi:hypothetical protein CYMTET_52571 [Cymbomonas tetramitiformis]|uniref:Uncharacterized protein n=1 Tax=Cymbomonas tetramitiformis TaxID=36881 RepID=A0AAE0BK27_9CHLO|nr:hypothetical protein CYMTET_52571 [Cymbomonas tetramitiformis]